MKEKTFFKLLGIAGFVLTGLFAWFMWGPVLHWIWDQFPKDASWYGFVKIGAVVLIGWGGGIALPLVGAALSFASFMKGL